MNSLAANSLPSPAYGDGRIEAVSYTHLDCTQLWRHRYKNENFEARYECLRRGVLEVCGYARKKMSVVSRMCLYVEENYGDCGLSLELVASEMGLNSSYLSRAFKKEMNQKFSDYLVTVRIEQAQKLLRADVYKRQSTHRRSVR